MKGRPVPIAEFEDIRLTVLDAFRALLALDGIQLVGGNSRGKRVRALVTRLAGPERIRIEDRDFAFQAIAEAQREVR